MAIPYTLRTNFRGDQYPVSGLGRGAAGRPGWRGVQLRQRIEIARDIEQLVGGTRNPTSYIYGEPLPLGYLHDLAVYAYYESVTKEQADIDDDAWEFKFEVASSNDRITLEDGQEYSVVEADEVSWTPLELAYPGVTAETNKSSTVIGQPTDGSGIQSLTLGQTGVQQKRPSSMRGHSSYEWIRVALSAETPADRRSVAQFTIRYFVNQWSWDRTDNPFEEDHFVPLQPGVSKVTTERRVYGSYASDLTLRPSQNKAQ